MSSLNDLPPLNIPDRFLHINTYACAHMSYTHTYTHKYTLITPLSTLQIPVFLTLTCHCTSEGAYFTGLMKAVIRDNIYWY